ncbi:MAG: glycosyltransferase family 87 protein [Candidatus Omnitrophota bacterium]|jgi:hypothetical protein
MEPIRKSLEFFIRKKWLGPLAVFILFYAVGISTLYRGAIGPTQRTDLTVYLKAAEMVQIGNPGHMYGIENSRHWHYVYSPLLAILLAPLATWPIAINVILAYFLSLACLTGAIILSRYFTDRPETAPWQIALAGVFCLPLFLNTLTRGQLSVFILFFEVLIFYCYLKNWKILTGLFFSFIVAIKISPLAFLFFFFLIKKKWKILISALLGFLFFFFIFPSLVLGVDVNWRLLTTWQDLMAQGSSAQAYNSYLWNELFTPFASDNQSLYAILTRLCGPSEANFMNASNAGIRFIASAFGILLLILLFLKKLPSMSSPRHDRVKLLAEYSLYPMVMLIASPVSSLHHYTVLYLLFLATLFLIEQQPHGSSRRVWLITGLWSCAFLLFAGYVIRFLKYVGSPLWGSLFLCGIVFFCLNSDKKQKPS